MKAFFVQRWFLLALVVVLYVGISQAEQIELLAEITAIRYGIVATVMFSMALPLDARAMSKSLRNPWPPLLASILNFVVLPLLAWGIAWLLSPEMRAGLFVAAATPCTLASASVFTRRAGGNDSVAILVTVITNLACFLLTPLWLFWMTGGWPDIESLSLPNMIFTLATLVVLPMALAQGLRQIESVGQWATRRKTPLGVIAQFGVLAMVLMGSIRLGIKLNGASLELGDFLAMTVAVLGLHLGILAMGMGLGSLVGFSRGDRIAVGIAGSQKTLMVGLQVGIDLGMSILPIVVFHIGQLLLDTIIADRLRKGDPAESSIASP